MVRRLGVSQFEYVAVLISIIVGLALTQLLRGVGRMVTSKDGMRPYSVHLIWTLYLFINTAMFWWWEFQLSDVTWNLLTYSLLIIYATLLFFASLMLQPGKLVGVNSYKEYYYLNRHWFFGLLIAIAFWDFVDTFAKGVSHLSELGTLYVTAQIGQIVGSAVAIATKSERYHKIFAIALILTFAANMVQLHFSY